MFIISNTCKKKGDKGTDGGLNNDFLSLCLNSSKLGELESVH